VAEEQWEIALRRHDDYIYAHGARIHDERNRLQKVILGGDEAVRVLIREDRERMKEIETVIDSINADRNEIKTVLKVLRWELAGVGAMILTFGAAILGHVWGKW